MARGARRTPHVISVSTPRTRHHSTSPSKTPPCSATDDARRCSPGRQEEIDACHSILRSCSWRAVRGRRRDRRRRRACCCASAVADDLVDVVLVGREVGGVAARRPGKAVDHTTLHYAVRLGDRASARHVPRERRMRTLTSTRTARDWSPDARQVERAHPRRRAALLAAGARWRRVGAGPWKDPTGQRLKTVLHHRDNRDHHPERLDKSRRRPSNRRETRRAEWRRSAETEIGRSLACASQDSNSSTTP